MVSKGGVGVWVYRQGIFYDIYGKEGEFSSFLLGNFKKDLLEMLLVCSLERFIVVLRV